MRKRRIDITNEKVQQIVVETYKTKKSPKLKLKQPKTARIDVDEFDALDIEEPLLENKSKKKLELIQDISIE